MPSTLSYKKKKLLTQKILSNGVPIYFSKHTSQFVNIAIVTKVGSTAENPENYGIAHILEHMFFKGSQKRPESTTISRSANDIGARLNAYTHYDHTVYYITTLKEYFFEAFDILADMYSFPLFPPEELEKERQPILSELREREDDPSLYIFEQALMKFYTGHYHSIIGNEASIQSATIEDVKTFRNQYYGGENVFMVVVGDLSPAMVKKAGENSLCVPEHTKRPPHLKSPRINKNEELYIKKSGLSEVYYSLIYPALPIADKDRLKQDLMVYILGGNESSFLFERIREDLAMSCYGIYASTMRNHPFSVLEINCGIAFKEYKKLHLEVQAQIDNLCNEKVSLSILNRSKAAIKTSLIKSLEYSAGTSQIIIEHILQESLHEINETLDLIEECTADDILSIAQKTFVEPSLKTILSNRNIKV